MPEYHYEIKHGNTPPLKAHPLAITAVQTLSGYWYGKSHCRVTHLIFKARQLAPVAHSACKRCNNRFRQLTYNAALISSASRPMRCLDQI